MNGRIIETTGFTDYRPWGHYTILSDESDHKVKRIAVNPGQRLSLQKHMYRSEHWYIIQGDGIVTVGESISIISVNQTIDIPVNTWHRIQNHGTNKLVFIEIQTGSYFGEDDIERKEDDYGRNLL